MRRVEREGRGEESECLTVRNGKGRGRERTYWLVLGSVENLKLRTIAPWKIMVCRILLLSAHKKQLLATLFNDALYNTYVL